MNQLDALSVLVHVVTKISVGGACLPGHRGFQLPPTALCQYMSSSGYQCYLIYYSPCPLNLSGDCLSLDLPTLSRDLANSPPEKQGSDTARQTIARLVPFR